MIIQITVFKDKLNNADWSSIIQEPVPKLAFDSFESVLSKCYLESFPLIQRKESKHVTPVEPWITKAMLVSRKTKNKLQAKSNKNPTPFNIKKYKHYTDLYCEMQKIIIIKINLMNTKQEYQTNLECSQKSSKIN